MLTAASVLVGGVMSPLKAPERPSATIAGSNLELGMHLTLPALGQERIERKPCRKEAAGSTSEVDVHRTS